MTDAELMPWDRQVEAARAAMEQAFTTADAMADRIEALTAEMAKDQRFIKELCDQIEQLNAKVADWSVRAEKAETERDALKEQLDAAVDALERIAAEASVPVRTKKKGGIKHKWMYRGWRKIAVERIDIARATLAKIKEGKL